MSVRHVKYPEGCKMDFIQEFDTYAQREDYWKQWYSDPTQYKVAMWTEVCDDWEAAVEESLRKVASISLKN